MPHDPLQSMARICDLLELVAGLGDEAAMRDLTKAIENLRRRWAFSEEDTMVWDALFECGPLLEEPFFSET